MMKNQRAYDDVAMIARNGIDGIIALEAEIKRITRERDVLAQKLASEAGDYPPCDDEDFACPHIGIPSGHSEMDCTHDAPRLNTCWLIWARQQAEQGETT